MPKKRKTSSSRLRKKQSGPPKHGLRRTKNQKLAAVNKGQKRGFPQTPSTPDEKSIDDKQHAEKEDLGSKNSSSSPRPLVTEDFDLAKLRARSGTSAAATTPASNTVRVEKPNPMRFVYIHPSWRETLYIIPKDEKRKPYLVVPDVEEQFPQLCRAALIVPYASEHGNWFLWDILLENRAGRISDFSESALQRVHEADGRWVRIESDMDNRSYRMYVAPRQRDPPTWPSGGMGYLIRKGFEDRIIENCNASANS
jgi:hypothetical protein